MESNNEDSITIELCREEAENLLNAWSILNCSHCDKSIDVKMELAKIPSLDIRGNQIASKLSIRDDSEIIKVDLTREEIEAISSINSLVSYSKIELTMGVVHADDYIIHVDDYINNESRSAFRKIEYSAKLYGRRALVKVLSEKISK